MEVKSDQGPLRNKKIKQIIVYSYITGVDDEPSAATAAGARLAASAARAAECAWNGTSAAFSGGAAARTAECA